MAPAQRLGAPVNRLCVTMELVVHRATPDVASVPDAEQPA